MHVASFSSARPRVAHIRGAAALVVAVAACSDPGAAPEPDALPPDAASPDAVDATITDASIDAALGAMTVHVRRDGAPEANVIVVAHDGDGEPLASTTTDATGTATMHVPLGGGAITVIFTGCSDYAPTCLKSYAGVVPGQELVVNRPTSKEAPRFVTRVRMPGAFDSGFYSVVASNGCASETWRSTAGDYVIQRFGTEGCFNDPSNPRLQLMGIAIRDGAPIGFARLLDAEIPAAGETITLGPWSSATTPYTLTFDDPGGTTPWRVSVSENQGLARWPLLSTTPTTRAPFTAVRPGIPGTGVTVRWSANVGAAADAETNIRREHRGLAAETGFEISTSTPLLTTLETVIVDRRPSITWAFDSDAGDLDGASMTLEAMNGLGLVSWYYMAPATPTIQFPAFPPALAGYAPYGVPDPGRLYFTLYGASIWNGFADMQRAFLAASNGSRFGAVAELEAQEYFTQRAVPRPTPPDRSSW